VDRARRGEGPTLIEARTYRFDEHQVGLNILGDPYRSAEEVQHYIRDRDPVKLFRDCLLESGFSEQELQVVEDEAATAVARAIDFGKSSPLPVAGDVYQHMYVNPTNYPRVPRGA